MLQRFAVLQYTLFCRSLTLILNSLIGFPQLREEVTLQHGIDTRNKLMPLIKGNAHILRIGPSKNRRFDCYKGQYIRDLDSTFDEENQNGESAVYL